MYLALSSEPAKVVHSEQRGVPPPRLRPAPSVPAQIDVQSREGVWGQADESSSCSEIPFNVFTSSTPGAVTVLAPPGCEYIWQVRSGDDAKGPWMTLPRPVSEVLDANLNNNTFVAIFRNDDGCMHYYDLLAWEQQLPGEEFGRPLRRVRWGHQHDDAWSP